MRRRIVILLAAAVTLASCKSAPESVKENTQKGDISALQMKNISLSEMNENVSDYENSLKELELDNIAIAEDIVIDIPQRMKTGEFICTDGFEENYKELFSYYCENFDRSKVIFDETTYPTGPIYEDNKNAIYLSCGCTGFFAYYKDFDDEKYYNESELVRTFTYSEAANASEKYKLADSRGEISPAEAAELAQDFAEEFVQACDYANDFSVSRISLWECADGYFYEADYTQLASGVKMLEYKGKYDSVDENLVVPSAFAYICSDDVNAFVVNSCFEEHEIDGELTEVCDPIVAAQYVSATLAGNMDLRAGRIALEYYMVKTGNIQQSTESEPADREKVLWAAYCSYDVYKAVPCWVFYFDETVDKEIYAIFDCDDMSVTFVDNSKAG